MTTQQDVGRFMNSLDYQGRTARAGLRQGAFTRATIVAVEDLKLRRVTVSVDIRRTDQEDATVSGVQIIGINEQAPPRVGQEIAIIRAGASGRWLGIEIPVDPTDVLQLFTEQALADFVPGHNAAGAPIGVPDFTMRVWYDAAIESMGSTLPNVSNLAGTEGLFVSGGGTGTRRGVGIEARGGGWSSDFTCTVANRENNFPVLQNYAPILEPQPLITYKVAGPQGLQVSPAALRKLSQVGFLTFILGSAAEDSDNPNRLIPPTLDTAALVYVLSGQGGDVVTYGGRFRSAPETIAVEVVRMGGLVQTRHLIPQSATQSQLRVLTEVAYPVDPVADHDAMYYGSHIIGGLLTHGVSAARAYTVGTPFTAIPVGAHHPVHHHEYPEHLHEYPDHNHAFNFTVNNVRSGSVTRSGSGITATSTDQAALLETEISADYMPGGDLVTLDTDVPTDLGVEPRPPKYI